MELTVNNIIFSTDVLNMRERESLEFTIIQRYLICVAWVIGRIDIGLRFFYFIYIMLILPNTMN